MRKTDLTVWIGWDSREPIAAEVLEYSIRKHASEPIDINFLKLDELKEHGFDRPLEKRNGRFWDPISEAYASTEFACSRFMALLIQKSGIGVFMDCDMLFVDDIFDLYQEIDPRKAVHCVQHNHIPTSVVKMDGQKQTIYPRKNWSSFFVFNADHPANDNLTLNTVNTVPGRHLHRFCWLHDREIGALQPGWNWLVNEQPKPTPLYNAHFTLGGPWFDDWVTQKNDDLWDMYFADYKANK